VLQILWLGEPVHAITTDASSAVRRAWRTVLGAKSLHAGLTLAESGCDSLRLLQFVLVLEHELNHPVALDIISDTMRPAEVAAALCRLETQTGSDDALPVVFLMPGLDDDEKRLALFRTALRNRVRFILIEYPDWPEMARPGWGFADMIDAVTRQVLRRDTDGPVLLTGYSFGGQVAFFTACRLVEQGCPVRWLGILDTDITDVPQPLSGGLFERMRHYFGEIAHDVRHDRLHKSLGLFLAKLAREGAGLTFADRTAPWWRALLPLRTQFWFDRRTRSILRMRALWASSDAAARDTLDVPATLFRSEAGRGSSPPDLGWGACCPALSIVPISGDHHTLFDPPYREELYIRYADEVERIALGSVSGACTGSIGTLR
jgi:thioesterase domain-containing protein